ncbi:uncharacterized protein BXZ73DRAFT_91856 [Epithele typhae]|uniref:uncharacterized protein n=1 Tax=Epithele typhae TaxID=378194 RepID=UPI002007B075|nr:uncharacterized protein BXZ73DRAFT_91856 [Epithele typhae]KAH9920820.1 hypothetical protein BXZ73DRAFT_91856 [Epithele typhae]
MHLVSLNLTDLLVSLFRGTIKCETTDKKTEWGFAVLQGDAWKTHGAQVADCTRFLPGSFDRPPRNPAEKIKSGYKAWEFLMYIFGLGPCLFYASPLPIEFFRNFCRLVRAIRITLAYTIHADDLVEAHNHFVQFSTEFEELYYKRRPDRLHFIRQSIHALSHICPEVHRLGPQACYTQWVMERAIGSFVQELRNHSNPYANLSERFIRRAQLNALKAMFPGLEHSKYKTGEYPKGAEEVGSGYVLLRAVDAKEHTIRTAEGKALRDYLRKHDPIIHNGEIRYGEVQYFLQLNIGAQKQAVALLSLWSLPEPQLLELSYSTIHSCLPSGDEGLVIIPVHCIQSVVAMIPHPAHIPSNDGHIEYRPVNVAGRWCVVEKPGLEVAYHAGRNEDIFAQDEGNGEGGQGSAETMRGDD